MWAASYLASATPKLVYTFLLCLVMSREGQSPHPLMMASSAGRGLIFTDVAFDKDHFKVGSRGPALGGPVLRCHPNVATQREAKLNGLVQGFRLIVNVSSPIFSTGGWQCFPIGKRHI